MPRVPSRDGPTVKRRALQVAPQRQPTSAAFQGGTTLQSLQVAAQSSGQLAQVLQLVQQRKEDREDSQAVFQAQTALGSEYLQFSREQREQRQGAKAKGVTNDFSAWITEHAGKHNEKLTNDRQRREYQKSVAQLIQSGTDELAKYESQQLEFAHDKEWQNSKIVAARIAISNPSPENVTLIAGQIQEKNAYQAARRGLPVEWVQNENAKDLTQMHGEIITARADKDPEAAKAHYQKYKDQIAPERHAQIEKALDEADDLVKIQENADVIAKMAAEQNMSRAEVMSHIQDNFEGIEEKNLKAEVNSRLDVIETDLNERRQELFEDLQLAEMNGQHTPPSKMNQLNGAQQASLIKMRRGITAARLKASQGKPVKTNWKVYTKLRALPDEEFIKVNLAEHTSEVAGAQLEQLADRQDTLKKALKEGKSSAKSKLVASNARHINHLADYMGLEGAARANFAMQADQAIYDKQVQKGEPLNDAERDAAIKPLTMPVVQPGLIWNGEQPRFAVPDGEPVTFVVPDKDRDEIENDLRIRGLPVSDEEVQRLYRLGNNLE